VTAERLLATLLTGLPDTLAGKRDPALLALGFASAFRRSELVALTVADLALVDDGYRVTIHRSKTDQEGRGAEIAIPAAPRHGWRRQRSALGRSSGRWRSADRYQPRPWRATARGVS
jgi:integrase